MRVNLFLIVAIVALSLPCVELPEWAGMYDDASNDFVLLPSRVEAPIFATAGSTPRLRAGHVDLDPQLIIFTSLFADIPFANESHSLLDRLTVQKK